MHNLPYVHVSDTNAYTVHTMYALVSLMYSGVETASTLSSECLVN